MPAKRHHQHKDRYRAVRGGSSAYLTIGCAACGTPLLLYQKDGPGTLYRMYLDRILAPPALASLQHTCASKEDMPNLTCPACGAVVAAPAHTPSARRLAFRVIRGRLVKKRSNGVFPPDKFDPPERTPNDAPL
jgi:ribosomal protein S27E